MKHILSLLVTLLLGTSVLAQKGVNCRIEKSNNEFNTGVEVNTAKVKLVSIFPVIGNKSPWTLWMFFYKKGDTMQVGLIHSATQTYASVVSLIYFKFTDGTVLKLTEPTRGLEYKGGIGTLSSISYKNTLFTVTKADFETFAKKQVEKVHIEFASFYDDPIVEKEIKGKNARIIQEDATCILRE